MLGIKILERFLQDNSYHSGFEFAKCISKFESGKTSKSAIKKALFAVDGLLKEHPSISSAKFDDFKFGFLKSLKIFHD